MERAVPARFLLRQTNKCAQTSAIKEVKDRADTFSHDASLQPRTPTAFEADKNARHNW